MQRASAMLCIVAWAAAEAHAQSPGPTPLSFDDLVALASSEPAAPQIEARLAGLLSEPFIRNDQAADGASFALRQGGGAKSLRLAEWNINRENNPAMTLAFSDWRGFEKLAMENPRLNARKRRQAVEEAQTLEAADVIVLNEVDDGEKRTGYRNVAGDLAARLHMNYVYATEFIELTPLYLGLHGMDQPDLPRQRRASEKYGVDPRRYLGLEGTALLSRLPIRSAKIVPLPAGYDWYNQEIGAISKIKQTNKSAAGQVFRERLKRQVRRGGRIALIVELALPEPARDGSRVLTVVCPHLEDYAPPKDRRSEMDYLLDNIRSTSTPAVMAGDLNTMGHNAAPVASKSLLKDYLLSPAFLARQAKFALLPAPGVSYILAGFDYLKNFHDPTRRNVTVVAAHNDSPLFKDLAGFRFVDGTGFDWAGRKQDSYGARSGALSVTNQRGWKGFTPTFALPRTFHGLVGNYKLDWILVKTTPALDPRNGRTLRVLNFAPRERISDHSPTVLDLRYSNVRH